METHEHDPTSDETADPWRTFQGTFSGLGEQLRETYRSVGSDDGPSEEEIRTALGTLGAAWSQVAESFGAAIQDPEVRTRLKDAAGAFASAVGRTISELGVELNQQRRDRAPEPADEEPDGEA